jgi:hypothetical protein
MVLYDWRLQILQFTRLREYSTQGMVQTCILYVQYTANMECMFGCYSLSHLSQAEVNNSHCVLLCVIYTYWPLVILAALSLWILMMKYINKKIASYTSDPWRYHHKCYMLIHFAWTTFITLCFNWGSGVSHIYKSIKYLNKGQVVLSVKDKVSWASGSLVHIDVMIIAMFKLSIRSYYFLFIST